MENQKPIVIFTIGHSIYPLDKFIGLLKAHEIELLADIRTIPRSRRNPQFNIEAYGESLSQTGIGYIHLKELGGLRHPLKDSPNSGWKNDSFRGYADYMQTIEFKYALDNLLDIAQKQKVAIMCAEGNPYRCHRSLVADALLSRRIEARHISSKKSASPHKLTPFAKIDGDRVSYPSP